MCYFLQGLLRYFQAFPLSLSHFFLQFFLVHNKHIIFCAFLMNDSFSIIFFIYFHWMIEWLMHFNDDSIHSNGLNMRIKWMFRSTLEVLWVRKCFRREHDQSFDVKAKVFEVKSGNFTLKLHRHGSFCLDVLSFNNRNTCASYDSIYMKTEPRRWI